MSKKNRRAKAQKPGTGNRRKLGRKQLAQNQEAVEQGLSLHRKGYLPEADGFYQRVLATDPTNADALHLSGLVALATGKAETAVEKMTLATQLAPGHADPHANLGFALLELGRQEEAVAACKRALALDPDHVGALNNLGNAYKLGKHYEPAIEAYRRAIALNPQLAEAHFNLGTVFQELGDVDQAIASFERALEANESYLKAYNNLSVMWIAKGDLDKAYGFCRQVLERDPNFAEAHNNLGEIHRRRQEWDEAIEALRAAIGINPHLSGAHTNLVALLEKSNRLAEAREALAEAQERDSGFQVMLCRARLEFRDGEMETAKKRLTEILPQAPSSKDLARAQYLLGAVHDKLGEYDSAFETYSRANRTVYASNREAVEKLKAENPNYAADPRPLEAGFLRADLAEWNRYRRKDGLRNPVFITGFARSGTTLLDQILNAHSRVITLEEKNTLQGIRSRYYLEGGLESLAEASEEELHRCRRDYWEAVAGFLSKEKREEKEWVIDRNPFYTPDLGLVNRLFPEAKIVMVLRDPRDVCLSCFMQDFELNPAVCNFLTLEESAEYYARTMRLFLLFCEGLSLDIHYLRYESLIRDFESEVRRLTGFLGLEWEEGLLRYREKIKERYVTTASSSQVVEPLYAHSIARWKNYRKALEPVQSVLAPYLDLGTN